MKLNPALVWLVVGCLVLVGAIAVFQRHLLYFPARARVAQMATANLKPWPSADDFRGLVAEPVGPPRGTSIVFHGNAGHAGDREHYAAALAPLGLRVILAEYPAYGPRPGEVGERPFVDDAAQSIALAHRLHGGPLLVIGESLGAGVAAAAASRQTDSVAALMLITPWDRLQSVAGHHYPWLPVGWLLRDRYDSSRHLAGFGKPVLVVVAERDTVVPARFGRRLHEALAEPRRLLVVPGAEHNDWPDRVDPAWWQQALSFLLPGPPPTRH